MTGVDEHTDVDRLNDLSWRFPFVEWGLLFSASAGGTTDKGNRYPTVRHMMPRGKRICGNVAVHLCGRWARQAARRDAQALFGMATILVPGTRRVQLNISNEPEQLLMHEITVAALHTNTEVIIQTRNFASPAADPHRAVAVHLLHDCSGGRGLYTPFEAPPKRLHSSCHALGFAGGIGTENIEHVCRQIIAMPIPNPVWIDMEGQVRTNDKFDLDKVERILEAAFPFVTMGMKI
jgi:hypothetical protein